NVTFSGARGDDAEVFLMRVRESRIVLPHVFGKRGDESLGRVSATSVDSIATRVFQIDVLQYTSDALHVPDSTPLQYFRVFVAGHPLMALMDSGSGRMIFGQEGIAIVRRLGWPTNRATGVCIRTANGQIAEIPEEIKIPLTLCGGDATRN
ncbi:hypothetical protein ALC57_00667, partial [Trachymyrmex cornetzi]